MARAKKNVTRAIERVSARLGNTPTICRKCYVHPEVVNAYLNGRLLLEVRKDVDDQLSVDLDTLNPEEAAVLAFLRSRGLRDTAVAAATAMSRYAAERNVQTEARPRAVIDA
jgi:DNA topoisomerase-1